MNEQLENLFVIAFEETDDYKFFRDNGMPDEQIFSKKNGKYECHPVRQAYIIWCEAMKIVNELEESLEAIKERYQDIVWESWGEDN